MAVSKCDWCDFVLRTDVDIFVQTLTFDRDNWRRKILPKLKSFYYKAILPELSSPRKHSSGIREPGLRVNSIGRCM